MYCPWEKAIFDLSSEVVVGYCGLRTPMHFQILSVRAYYYLLMSMIFILSVQKHFRTQEGSHSSRAFRRYQFSPRTTALGLALCVVLYIYFLFGRMFSRIIIHDL